MKYIEKISKLFNIDEIYIGLILKTIIIIFLILVVEKIGIRIIKRTRDSKKEYKDETENLNIAKPEFKNLKIGNENFVELNHQEDVIIIN